MSHFSRPRSFPLGFRNTWRQLLKGTGEESRLPWSLGTPEAFAAALADYIVWMGAQEGLPKKQGCEMAGSFREGA